jgi:hypothetical protein
LSACHRLKLIISTRAQQSERERDQEKPVHREDKGNVGYVKLNKFRFDVLYQNYYLDLICSYPTSALQACCSGRPFIMVDGLSLVTRRDRVLIPGCTLCRACNAWGRKSVSLVYVVACRFLYLLFVKKGPCV